MWVQYLPICLLVMAPPISGIYKASEEILQASNLPFRYELEQVASDFQERLRKELSVLEMEMYSEFLELVQEVDGRKRNLTSELSAELSKTVSEVMDKFTKVMIYSSKRSQDLTKKMQELMKILKDWANGDDSHLLSIINGDHLQGADDNSERNKRHTVHPQQEADYDAMAYQNVPKAKKTLELTPDDFPLTEDANDDVDAFLGSSAYFDGHLDLEDSEFTLRQYTPGTSSRYVMSKDLQSDEEVDAPSRKDALPRNCYDLLQDGNTQNGVYIIYPSGKSEGIQVWCEQTVAGGGWTVILGRREAHPPLNFTRTPTQYAHGFGTPSSNHWLGLEVMHELTQGISHTLRVHLQDQEGVHAQAIYDTFRVGSRDEEYLLDVGGYDNYSSTAEDALTFHSGRPFTTPLPAADEGCAHNQGVGWWYLEEPICYYALPTSHNQPSNTSTIGVEWWPWSGSESSGSSGSPGSILHSLSFMIRPSTI